LELVLEREFPRDEKLPHDELCFCDLTTAPNGAIVTVDARLAEIKSRYDPASEVRRFIELAETELVASVQRSEALLRGHCRPAEELHSGRLRLEPLPCRARLLPDPLERVGIE
jgi:hypothetical protein